MFMEIDSDYFHTVQFSSVCEMVKCNYKIEVGWEPSTGIMLCLCYHVQVLQVNYKI